MLVDELYVKSLWRFVVVVSELVFWMLFKVKEVVIQIDELDFAYREFKEYAERFVKGNGADEDVRQERVSYVPPKKKKQEIVFSEETDAAIRKHGLEPKEVKGAVFEGLKLENPGKARAAHRGVHFKTTDFRKGARSSLNGSDPGGKMKTLERLLADERVIVYHKGRKELTLNTRKERVASGGVGDGILNSVIVHIMQF